MSKLLDLLGQERVARLASAVGGTYLYVPKHAGKPPKGGRNGFERLKLIAGEEIAVLLVFHFGDSEVYVPRQQPSTSVDPKRLKRLERKGLSARDIALAMDCTERTIEYHRARARSNGSGTERKE